MANDLISTLGDQPRIKLSKEQEVELINSLTPEGKTIYFSRKYYKSPPPTIDQFIHDPYYLGKMCGTADDGSERTYPCWREALGEIYPDTVHTKSYLSFNGSTRTGKSNTTKIIILYDICKLCHLNDPDAFFNLTPRNYEIVVGHEDIAKALGMLGDIMSWIKDSPYFQELAADPTSFFHRITWIPAKNPSQFIGKNCIIMWFSECNFYKREKGLFFINSGISRVEGTYANGKGFFTHIIMDSSDTGPDGVVPTILKSGEGHKFKQYRYSLFDAKPWQFYKEHVSDHPEYLKFFKWGVNEIDMDPDRYMNDGRIKPNPNFGKKRTTFRVYVGSYEHYAQICDVDANGKSVVVDWMDEDKLVDVPLELLSMAVSDMVLFLNEKCGRYVLGTENFFSATRSIPHFNIPQKVTYDFQTPANVISIDQWNEDEYYPMIADAIEQIPVERSIFGRIDLGLSNDKCGVAIGYIDSLREVNMDGVKRLIAHLVVPIVFAISRPAGQETSIEKLVDMVQQIHTHRTIQHWSCDTFQSFYIKQKLNSIGIPCDFISVDRTYNPYKIFKEELYKGNIDICDNKIVKTELLNVYDTGRKIDHHSELNELHEEGSNSKDQLDALVGLCYDMICQVNTRGEDVMQCMLVTNSSKFACNKSMLDALNQRHAVEMSMRRAGVDPSIIRDMNRARNLYYK